jgi:hypothetical protein
MMAYEPTVEDVGVLIENGVITRVTNGLNVAMAIHTLHLLPIGDPKFRYSTIIGLEGQKVTMMSNEHVGIVGVVMPQGIRDYDLRQAA